MFNRNDRSLLGIWWWTVDKWMLALTVLLAVVGVFLVMAASPPVAERINLSDQHFVIRHGIFLSVAMLAMLCFSMLSHRQIRIISLIALFGSMLLIGMSIMIGPEIKGASRWIPFGPIKIQPSEFVKPFFIVVNAWLLSLWRDNKNFPRLEDFIGILALLLGLLLMQPDVGMSILIVITWSFQIFLAGMPLAIVILLVGIVAPVSLYSAYTFLPHVADRIEKFMAGGGMQAKYAMRSFANGGLFGVGPGEGVFKYHLPDAHADFIFAVAGEEFGLIFCILLIGLFATIMFRGFHHAFENAGNIFLILAIGGISLQLGVQAAIHIASSAHIMPTKGMTLPFISYGGSSLLATGISLGILLALTRQYQQSGRPI